AARLPAHPVEQRRGIRGVLLEPSSRLLPDGGRGLPRRGRIPLHHESRRRHHQRRRPSALDRRHGGSARRPSGCRRMRRGRCRRRDQGRGARGLRRHQGRRHTRRRRDRARAGRQGARDDRSGGGVQDGGRREAAAEDPIRQNSAGYDEKDRRGDGVHAARDDRRSGDPHRDHRVAQNSRLSAEVAMKFPLTPSTPAQLGLDPSALDRLIELVTRHVTESRYPGAQLAIARHGKLALLRTIGDARLAPARVPAGDDTLWLLYSNTKVLTACAVWLLAERGALVFTDPVAVHLPGFEANGKGEITIIQLLTHQGGFPNADMPPQAWDDHELIRKTVCEYALEWEPGSRVHYHGRAAHWTAAAMIEA